MGALWGKFLCVVRLFGTISMMRRGRGWDGSESVGKAAARSELRAGAAQTESTALSLSIGMVWVSFPPF